MKITINVPETAHGLEIIESIAFHGGIVIPERLVAPSPWGTRPVTIETIDLDG